MRIPLARPAVSGLVLMVMAVPFASASTGNTSALNA